MTPTRRQHDISQEQPRGFEIESVESVHARGCEGVHSTRLVAASHLVAVLDRMVTGVTDGDHKMAAELRCSVVTINATDSRCNRSI